MVDTRHHKLEILDVNGNTAGFVRVDKPLARPTGAFLDRERMELWVANNLSHNVIRYKLPEKSLGEICIKMSILSYVPKSMTPEIFILVFDSLFVCFFK